MRISLVLCAIVLMRSVDRAACNLGEFLNNLPTEISNAFSTAWATIMKAIRKPVRIKRLGSTGKPKTTSTLTTGEIKQLRTHKSTLKYDMLHPSLKRLMLPIITTPRWRNLEEWKKLQKPAFLELKPGLYLSTSPFPYAEENNEIGVEQRPSKLDEDDNLGVLMFI